MCTFIMLRNKQNREEKTPDPKEISKHGTSRFAGCAAIISQLLVEL